MKYASIAAFLEEWKEEAVGTGRYLDTLTDPSLEQSVARDHRTLGRMARHLIETIHEMMPRTGLRLPPAPAFDPERCSEIAAAYRTAARDLGDAIASQWTDADLGKEDDMYGFRWTRAYSLSCLVLHQAHHRGQMSVLMRQAGLRVPGVYGPAREEWVTVGAPIPEI